MPTLKEQADKIRSKGKKEVKGKQKTKKKREREIIFGSDKITVNETDKNGKGLTTTYDTILACINCGNIRLISSQTASCPICDMVITEKNYNKRYYNEEKPRTGMTKAKAGKTVRKKKEVIEEQDDDAFADDEFIEDDETTVKTIAYTDKLDYIEKTKDVIDITEETDKHYEIQKIEDKHEIITTMRPLPSKEEVDSYYEMYKYVKMSIVDPSDFHEYKKGEPRMKKSGWRKFIKPFNLSVKMVREKDLGKENPRIYKEGNCLDGSSDIHAEVMVVVSVTGVQCPNCGMNVKGQSIEAIGIKSKSDYWSDKWENFGGYSRQNLITTARTRAINQGISDLVGYGDVSYEEIYNRKDKVDTDEDINPDSADLF